MSVSSQSDGRQTKSVGVDEALLPPFVHQLDTRLKEYEREGDIEFPFEDTTGAGDENRMRGNWSSRTDSLLAFAGFTFGLGNLWRFPFLVHQNGGAAFLIPFIVCLFVAAVPIFFLELAIGQFSSLAAISVWKAVPLFKGIGISSVLLSCVLSVYLSVVASWTIFYLANSVGFALPWSNCENAWSGLNCTSAVRVACAEQNGTLLVNGSCVVTMLTGVGTEGNGSTVGRTETVVSLLAGSPPTLGYFHNDVLMLSSGVERVATLNWYLGICLLIAWLATFLCLFQGVKSAGKAVYVMVLLPYIIMTVLIVRLLTLDGSIHALAHFMRPDFSKLTSFKVWGEAAIHAFYSLSCCTGGLITLSSYSRFHTNLLRDVWLVPLLDILCSLAACTLTFSAVGFTCRHLGLDIDKFRLDDGAHLIFVFLTEAISGMPAAPLYAGFFFLMLLLVILSAQIFVVETVVSSLCDHFAEYLRKNRRHVLALVSLALFTLSLPFCTSAGMYWLMIVDRFALNWPLIILAFLEVMAIAWVYGVDNLLDNIKWMTGKYPPVYLFWNVLYKYICPLIYMLILSFAWMEWKTLSYGSYVFPYWTSIAGWTMSLLPVLIIIVAAVEELIGAKGGFCERWRAVLNPDDSWGPALAIHRAEHFPLQIPEARRLLIACDDDFPGSEGDDRFKESRDESSAPPRGSSIVAANHRISTDQASHAATIASVPTFERETAI